MHIMGALHGSAIPTRDLDIVYARDGRPAFGRGLSSRGLVEEPAGFRRDRAAEAGPRRDKPRPLLLRIDEDLGRHRQLLRPPIPPALIEAPGLRTNDGHEVQITADAGCPSPVGSEDTEAHEVRMTRPLALDQARTAAITSARSGHLRMDELEDRTGMVDRLARLDCPIVLERRSPGWPSQPSRRPASRRSRPTIAHRESGVRMLAQRRNQI